MIDKNKVIAINIGMNLINKKLIQSKLRSFHGVDSQKLEKIKELIKAYQHSINSGNLEKTKEVSVQGQFLQHFFEEILGYHFMQRSPDSWQLEHEGSIKGGSADGILGFFTPQSRTIRAVIELKDAKTDLDKKQKRENNESPVEQGHRYAAGVDGCNWIIVSNFKEIRLYSKLRSKDYYESFEVLNLLEGDELKRFLFLLGKGNLFIESGISVVDSLVQETNYEVKEVSDKFYKEYKTLRRELFQNLIEHNPDVDKLVILEKTQKILDRYIFVLFAEDTQGLLPNEIAKQTYDLGIRSRERSDEKVWREFRNLFQDIDEGRHDVNPPINKYNGGLFAPDEVLDNLHIKDGIWTKLITLSDYDFESTLDVNILGHIFEQSINDLEDLKSEVDGQTVDKKKSKRKKDGIFYTPEYITKYIVENTIGKYLEDNPDSLENIKVLDPACGSGAFLNQAHKFLTQEYEARYQREVEEKEASGEGADLFTYNPAETNRSILLNNLYGVDLQPESVEITKLSLWLKTATKNQPLQNLDKNIKAGNSLTISWKEQVNSNGFQAIIGNPPYIKEYTNKSAFDGLHDSPYYQGKMDLWTLFACQSIDELEEGGYLAYIAPNNWVSNAGASIFRDKILSDGEILTFIDFGDFKVFQDAGIQTMVFVFKKCKPRDKYYVNYFRIEDKNLPLDKVQLLLNDGLTNEFEGVNAFQAQIETKQLIGKNLSFVDKKVDEILDQMQESGRWFLDKKEVAQGIVAPQEFVTERHLENSSIEAERNEGIFQITSQEKEKLNFTTQELEYIKPFYTTEQLGRYTANPQNNLWVIYTGSDIKTKIDNLPNIKAHLDRFSEVITSDNKPYGLHRARDEKFFKGDKVVSLRKCTEPTFSYTDFDCYLSQTYYIIKTDKVNLKFLIGVLNSKIVAFWLRYKGKMQGDLYQIDKEPLINLPIPQATEQEQTQIASLVDQIMDLKKGEKEQIDKFLKLLEAEFDTKVGLDSHAQQLKDQMTGQKPLKITKKLEKYYDLPYSEFLDELAKQKIKLSLTQKSEWQEYFEKEVNKVKDLQNQINQIDQKIENIVIELYGLSEDDKKVLLNSA